jgi:hypothetical protein
MADEWPGLIGLLFMMPLWFRVGLLFLGFLDCSFLIYLRSQKVILALS